MDYAVGADHGRNGRVAGRQCGYPRYFDEVDIWLPTTLPGNAEWVDIVRLSSDGTYLDGMLEALIDEMLVPGSKKWTKWSI